MSLLLALQQLIASGAVGGDGLKQSIKVYRCFRATQEEVSVWPEQASDFGENLLLRLYVKIDEDITHENQVHGGQGRPGFRQVDLPQLHRLPDILSDLPLAPSLKKVFPQKGGGY